jgi:hypothetical protein
MTVEADNVFRKCGIDFSFGFVVYPIKGSRETEPFLLVAVGLEVQSDRVLIRLFPDQVAITLGLEVIKEFQPFVVASCRVSLKPFVQFFHRESVELDQKPLGR